MNPISRLSRSQTMFGLLIAVVVSLGIILLRNGAGLQFLELAAYDYCLYQRTKSAATNSPIVLITLSEDDIKTLGHYPINDGELAHLLTKVLSASPRVVGLDIYRDIPVPPGREALEKVFEENWNIVTVKKLGDDDASSVSAPYVVKESHPVGFSDILLDQGGTVRRALLFVDDGSDSHTSFALMISLIFLSADGIDPQADAANPSLLRLGSVTFKPLERNDGGYVDLDARGYQFLLDFENTLSPFQSFSLSKVMVGEVDLSAFRDKIVLIGYIGESMKDFFSTPFSRFDPSQLKVPGVVIHASAVGQIIRSALGGSSPIGFLSEGWEWCWIFLGGLTASLLCVGMRSLPILLISGLCSLAALAFITGYLFWRSVWFPGVPAGMAMLVSSGCISVYMFHQEMARRSLLMRLFSSHVSGDVAEVIWTHRDEFMDGKRPRPQKLTATVLFTDIQGFTSMSERMAPQGLIEWLNEYMEVMAGEVAAHQGVVNKYIGDGVMAVFGIPLARTSESDIQQDALNAVNCAIAMRRRIEDLNSIWPEKGWPVTRIRVGIYTGPLMVGSIGGAQRLEYTVIGDTVNIASRLESFDKDLDSKNACRILIGGATRMYVRDHFRLKSLSAVPLKGKSEIIEIYQVLDQA